METINISTLKARLSEVLNKVRSGTQYTIMDRKTPVAILGAVADHDSLLISKLPVAKFAAPQGSKKIITVDVVKLLREDRDKR